MPVVLDDPQWNVGTGLGEADGVADIHGGQCAGRDLNTSSVVNPWRGALPQITPRLASYRRPSFFPVDAVVYGRGDLVRCQLPLPDCIGKVCKGSTDASRIRTRDGDAWPRRT